MFEKSPFLFQNTIYFLMFLGCSFWKLYPVPGEGLLMVSLTMLLCPLCFLEAGSQIRFWLEAVRGGAPYSPCLVS